MGEEALLELAKQFIQTPEGQKLIADQIDVDQIEKQLLKLEAGDNSNLTREERRERRAERRENRRERRAERRENRRERRAEEKIQLRAKIKSNIPVLKQFKIKGKLYDKQTGKPLEGVKIKAIEAIVFKGGKEGRQALRNERRESREERQDIKENSREELERLRKEVRKEDESNRELKREQRELNRSLTQEETQRRGELIFTGKATEESFNVKSFLYVSFKDGEDEGGNPIFGGRYSPSMSSSAKRALEDFKAKKRDQLAGTKVSKYQTDENGIFEAIISVVVFPSTVTIKVENDNGDIIEREIKVRDTDVSILKPKLLYTSSGYVPTTQEIINLDNTVKSDLNTIGLINIDIAAEQALAEVQTKIDEGVDKLNSIYLNAVEILIVAKRKSIMRVVEIIKTRLVPLAIGMLIAFGITKLTQKDQKTCPSPDQLKDIIRRRNSIVKQLNQIFAAVALNSALAVAFLAISQVVRGVRATIDGIPLPLSIGTPPGPAGGLIFAQTYSTVAKLQNVKDKLKELEESNKELNKQILIALLFLVVALIIILLLLKGIDNLIQECSKEDNIEFEEISKELLDLTQEAEEEGIPVINNINGFILSVETLKNTPGELKRRQAVAKDSRGITLLKGEPSFASSDQILIDELAFYIQQNNLKAN